MSVPIYEEILHTLQEVEEADLEQTPQIVEKVTKLSEQIKGFWKEEHLLKATEHRVDEEIKAAYYKEFHSAYVDKITECFGEELNNLRDDKAFEVGNESHLRCLSEMIEAGIDTIEQSDWPFYLSSKPTAQGNLPIHQNLNKY